MGTILTPQYVNELAALLDVKEAFEWSLPYALASTPLPDGWSSLVADNGSVSYVHDARPQAPQHEHPLLPRAVKALARLRATGGGGAAAAAASDGGARLLGPFENLDSPAVEYFYFDVESGAQVSDFECPPDSVIRPLPPDILQLLSASATASPSTSSSGEGPQPPPQQQQVERDGSQPASPAPALAGPDAGAGERGEAAYTSTGASGTGGPEPTAGASGRGLQTSGSLSGPASARPSRPKSAAASTTSRGGPAAPSAPIAEAGPGSHSSPTKPASRVDSARSAGPGAAAGGEAAGGASAAGTAAAAGGSRPGGASGAGGQRGSDIGGAAAEAPRELPAPSSPRTASRPASASASCSPQPALPASIVAAVADAAALSSTSSTSSTSSGLPADESEDDRAAYRRDACTTAGYAGSVSESTSGSSRGSRSGRGSGSSGAVADGGGAAAGEPLSRSASARSGAGSTASATSSGARSGGSGSGSGCSSRGSAAAGGVGVRPPVAPPSGRLTFYGWWFEDIESSDLTFRIDTKAQAGGGLAARHCCLVYDFATASYSFTIRDPVTPPAPGQPYERVSELTVPGLGSDQVAMMDLSRPADPWDLHLGARLRVLGRQVVLKNSDLATAQWHASYLRQLCSLRDKLAQEVQKYRPRALRPGLVADKGHVKLQAGQQLRHVALQVRELIEDLRQYRPGKAESFMAALPIQF